MTQPTPPLSPRGRRVLWTTILLVAVGGFGLSMAYVDPTSSRQRLETQHNTFVAWVTLQGEVVPSILALVFLVLVVFALVRLLANGG